MCNEICTKCKNCIQHEIEEFNDGGLFPHMNYILGVKCIKTNKIAYSAFDLQNKVYR